MQNEIIIIYMRQIDTLRAIHCFVPEHQSIQFTYIKITLNVFRHQHSMTSDVVQTSAQHKWYGSDISTTRQVMWFRTSVS
jgi:hypothetical protein